jgi:hypothetical protein
MSSVLLLAITIGFFILCNIFVIFGLKKTRARPTGRRGSGIKGKIRNKIENIVQVKMLFIIPTKTIDGIKDKIKTMTTDLISVQSGKMIRATSPIDEEDALNKYKQGNNLEMVIEHSILDDEYDRFMAEIELSEN